MEKIFANIKEFSAAIGFSTKWIQNQLKDDHSLMRQYVTPVKVTPSDTRYYVSEIQAYAEALRNPPTTASYAHAQANIQHDYTPHG
jgi:predicted DNA-binding transcriptional regulator AlpA